MPYKSKEFRFIIGLIIGVFGTILGIWLFPESVASYHWAVFGAAIACALGFSLLLYLMDYHRAENNRLRLFLRLYLFAISAVLVAPQFVPFITILGFKNGGKLIDALPLIAIFIAIAGAYLREIHTELDVRLHRDQKSDKT